MMSHREHGCFALDGPLRRSRDLRNRGHREAKGQGAQQAESRRRRQPRVVPEASRSKSGLHLAASRSKDHTQKDCGGEVMQIASRSTVVAKIARPSKYRAHDEPAWMRADAPRSRTPHLPPRGHVLRSGDKPQQSRRVRGTESNRLQALRRARVSSLREWSGDTSRSP